MNRIRILIVEGASLARQTMRDILDRDGQLEVVGAFATGQLALSKLSDLRPDVVVLDVAMPEREGLRTLASLRDLHPHLLIVMFSRLTERGSQTTLDALELGASGYVTKPESATELKFCVQRELASKIRAFFAVKNPTCNAMVVPSANQPVLLDQSPRQQSTNNIADIVVIASSTGGPNALASLLIALPPSFETPIVIVQHMSTGLTANLADSLRRQTGRDVREVHTAQSLLAASVWLAPGGRHIAVTRNGANVEIVPNDNPPENDCCPSANVLFRSVADVFGSRCLAVVLTGLGSDGLVGCQHIRNAGGKILVQDKASSIAWGMPGQVASAGLADIVLPLTELTQEICRCTLRRSEPNGGR